VNSTIRNTMIGARAASSAAATVAHSAGPAKSRCFQAPTASSAGGAPSTAGRIHVTPRRVTAPAARRRHVVVVPAAVAADADTADPAAPATPNVGGMDVREGSFVQTVVKQAGSFAPGMLTLNSQVLSAQLERAFAYDLNVNAAQLNLNVH